VSGDAAGDEPAIRIGHPVVDEGRLLLELVSPPGWPWLPPPEPGEPLAAYLERALLKDPFYLDVCRKLGDGPRLRIAPFRPSLTLAKWRERYPPKPLRRTYTYPDAVLVRLLVALCDQLRAGEVELRGVRLSSLAEERVPLALFRFEDMVLYPNTSDGGQLRPEGRLPEGLPEYRELTLWPGELAAEEIAAQPVPAGAAAPPSPAVAPTPAPEADSAEQALKDWLRAWPGRVLKGPGRETFNDWARRRLAAAKAAPELQGIHITQARLRGLDSKLSDGAL
jgi:hypothetical protein